VPDSSRRWEGDLAVHCDFGSRVQTRHLWLSAWLIGVLVKRGFYLMFGVARRVVENPRWRVAGVNKRANGAVGGDKGMDLGSIGRSLIFSKRKWPAYPLGMEKDQIKR
jgi:hypothetical protein